MGLCPYAPGDKKARRFGGLLLRFPLMGVILFRGCIRVVKVRAVRRPLLHKLIQEPAFVCNLGEYLDNFTVGSESHHLLRRAALGVLLSNSFFLLFH